MGSNLSSQNSHDDREEFHSISLDGSVRMSKYCDDGNLREFIFEDAKTVYEAFERGQKLSNDGDFLGRRRGGTGPYEWLTFSQVSQMANDFGSGLINECGLSATNDTFLGIFSQNRIEWIVSDQATARFSWVLVPLYGTLGKEGCKHILEETEMSVIICEDTAKVDTLLDLHDSLQALRHIIVMDDMNEDIKNRIIDCGLTPHTFDDVIVSGNKIPQPLKPADPSDISTICYTSGTTDRPKGVVITHKSLLINCHSALYTLEKYAIPLGVEDVHISYLPLAHIFERINVIMCLLTGSKCGFYSGNILKLIDDIQTLQPTHLTAVPRLLYKIYDLIYANAGESYVKRHLLDWAVSSKTKELKRGILRNDTIWDTIVFSKVRQLFGGRIRCIESGGAAVSPQVLSFFTVALSCHSLNGYGQTELCGPAFLSSPRDDTFDSVGAPLVCNMVKLVDVSDLNYFKNEGYGEICIKGPNVFTEYFKQPEKTKETIDEDGWVHTGDIGTWTSDGRMKIVDRCKQIFKLSQGEYIAPEKIEGVYVRCPHISQVFIDGLSDKSYIVAVVVPDFDRLKRTLHLQDDSTSLSDLCQDIEIKKMILDEMTTIARGNYLKGFEIVKKIYLNPEAFSFQNGLLTITMKSKRMALRKRFEKQIFAMYDD